MAESYKQMREVWHTTRALADLLYKFIYSRGCSMREEDWRQCKLLIGFLDAWVNAHASVENNSMVKKEKEK